MSEAIQIMLVIMVTTAVINLITRSAGRESEQVTTDEFTVRQPKAVFYVGAVCALVFAGFLVFTAFVAFTTEEFTEIELVLILGIFGLFAALGAFIMIYTVRWRIRVIKERIEYTSFSGKTELIRPRDIAYVLETSMKVTLFDAWNKKILVLDGPVVNRDALKAWLVENRVSFSRNDTLAERLREGKTRRERVYISKLGRSDLD